uniref:Sorting nexin-24 n=1 Tax=Lygus hesperus TaxID=30085 RepID=A0A0A9WFX1_LYGHE
MQEVFIPSYRLVDLPKPHYVYLIKILSRETGQQDLVERRYSAFHALHRELRKHFNTPPFPPKRIRCTQERVLEQRRKELEKYIQTMFRYVPTKPMVANFLGLTDNIQNVGEDKQMKHRPIYLMGPSYNGCVKSSLPDIVVEGVADALYGPP